MIIFLFFLTIVLIASGLSYLTAEISLWFIPLWIVVGIVVAFLLVILSVVIAAPIAKRTKVTSKAKHYYVRQLSDFLKMVLKMRVVKVIGRENIPKGNFVIYGNHKSNTDPFILVSAIRRPMGFAAKTELYKFPILRTWLRAFGSLNIDRANGREAAREIILGIKHIEKGLSMAIFPEGGIKTRETALMEEVKPGAYRLATKPGVPVLPVVILGSRHITNNAPWKKSKLMVIILPAITKEEYKDMTTVELGEHVKELINNTILEYQKKDLD
ncbi:MAG: 1-acyl-sn-glycerol-3-phosphate acyltransferase [Acholeplasmataceae bacterium]|nr:1-acyl-sn-glycerol-3-phosphate acyltransferase [Acholeplasmataceae bacterium]